VSPRGSAKERLKRLQELFNHDDRLLIPLVADPDAIASALALKRLLWRRVAQVTIARVNEVQRQDNLTLIRLLHLRLPHLSQVTVGDYTRLALVDGQPAHHEALAGLACQVVIDHHPRLDSTVADFSDIRPEYGATATILTEYLRAARITPSPPLATALFYALKTDTAAFSRPALAEDMAAFRYLFGLADQAMVRKIEQSEIPRRLIKDYAHALAGIRFRRDKAFVFLGRVENADFLVLIADFMMRIQMVDMAVAAGLTEDKLVVIFRNVRSRRSAGRLAERAFGKLGRAGGHQAAARAEVPLAALGEWAEVASPKAWERFIIQRGERR
jgi:nanoRNase/pAp phosphatase (c-di-AMP/oligoRNAs hydrolase)